MIDRDRQEGNGKVFSSFLQKLYRIQDNIAEKLDDFQKLLFESFGSIADKTAMLYIEEFQLSSTKDLPFDIEMISRQQIFPNRAPINPGLAWSNRNEDLFLICNSHVETIDDSAYYLIKRTDEIKEELEFNDQGLAYPSENDNAVVIRVITDEDSLFYFVQTIDNNEVQ